MNPITSITTSDARFTLASGEGADAVHAAPQYSYAVTSLHANRHTGTGLALTLGDGNDLVCSAAERLAEPLRGRDIEDVMATFGRTFSQLANHHQLRWLGPHKGVVHLALASITNACFDLWAKARGIPLWRLLLDLSPEQVVALLDLSYLEDLLTADEALDLLRGQWTTRPEREGILTRGYPGYDTSVGWFHYSDEAVWENARQAVDRGFTALKLKVGSPDGERDIRRAYMLREIVGDGVKIMLDANQQWTVPAAIRTCRALAGMAPYWIEEPTHPDDVLGHQSVARAIAPLHLALGEHVPNRVLFKNFMQLSGARYIQVDCTRVGGVSEFITISLLARKLRLPVVPHVGDMGQIHQHLVLFNRVALGLEVVFLEYIPHLRRHFRAPAIVSDGVYRTPQEPGSSSDLRLGAE